jgi:hypothetical protein
MPLVLKDRVKESSTTTGTGTLTLGGAAVGFQSFAVIGDGNTTYYAIVDSGTGDWEVGLGTYTSSGTTLSRDAVLDSSNSGSAVNFGAGGKDVFVTYPSSKSIYREANNSVNNVFASGTKMLFQQTAAPTGWTKDTTHDNKALRVVSGTVGSGGSVAFTTAFASQAVSGSVGDTTLTSAQMPTHTHSGSTALFRYNNATGASGSGFTVRNPNVGGSISFDLATTITNAGSSNSHNHSFTGTAIDLAVSYVDLIIATKD